MTKEEIVKYVMKSPENTNPVVLEGMLEELDNGGTQSQIYTFINSSATSKMNISISGETFTKNIEVSANGSQETELPLEPITFEITLIR